MDQLRVGFVGCGRHARANLYPAALLAGVKIVAVAARHLDHAQAAAAEFRAERAYDDHREMLKKETLDAVFVAVEERQQARIVTDALQAGHHLFVEKPLGLTEREAAAAAELAAKAGRTVMVGFMKRFAPAFLQMRAIAGDRASFGELLSLHGMFAIGSRTGWDDEWFIKTGGIHYVDLVRYLFGEVTEVRGFRNSRGIQVDQLFTMRFEDGRIGSLFFAGLPAWVRHHEELTVTGVSGFVRVENMVRVIYHIDRPAGTDGPRWQRLDEEDRALTAVHTSGSGGLKDLYLNGYVGEVRHFVDCVQHGTEPGPSAADNVKTMALCDRIIRAITS